jgi:hypothetical protein
LGKILTIEETKTTDELCVADSEDLPSGRYKCRIAASNHQEYIGRLWIKPGINVNEGNSFQAIIVLSKYNQKSNTNLLTNKLYLIIIYKNTH